MELPCDVKHCRAECCGIVPIPRQVYEQNKHLIEHPEEIELLEFDKHKISIIVVRGVQCGFLGSDFKCRIYNQRPSICKQFGEGGHPLLECHYLRRIKFYKDKQDETLVHLQSPEENEDK